MQSVAQTQPVTQTPSQRLVREIPGFIYRHRQTGELLGILSCDSGHWLETLDASGYKSERHLRDITNAHERVSQGSLRATREVVTDHGGEFAATRVVWSVDRYELLGAMRALEESRAAC